MGKAEGKNGKTETKQTMAKAGSGKKGGKTDGEAKQLKE